MADQLSIAGTKIERGSQTKLDLPVARLHTHTPVTMPVHVIQGKRDGPRLFVSAAVHGDEINGVEIIRRLLQRPDLKRIRGTLIAVPIVNIFGFLQHSRYLPDRRDLNRSFPGSERGSLAARLAHLFMTEIVSRCTHGIDLHTAAIHRTNLPQLRINLDDPEATRLARAFGTPVIVKADIREGSLREAAVERGIPALLYEAGEALRFDEVSVRAGVHGILNVMRALEMLPARSKPPRPRSVIAHSTHWVRAPAGGTLRTLADLGRRVRKDDVLGVVSDPLGEREVEICAPTGGIIIGRSVIPLVNEGDAVFHIARFEDTKVAADRVEKFKAIQEQEIEHDPEPGVV